MKITNKSRLLINEKYLENFSSRVTDEFSLARQSFHNTHNWVITLSVGIVAAILTITKGNNEIGREYGLIALLLSFPLILRFFIRSCLEYSIQCKWMEIRNSLDSYFFEGNKEIKKIRKKYLIESIKFYYFEWKSPISMCEIIKDNLKLAYSWPFILYPLLILQLISTPQSCLVVIIEIIVSVFIIYELCTFFKYRGFNYQKHTIHPPTFKN